MNGQMFGVKKSKILLRIGTSLLGIALIALFLKAAIFKNAISGNVPLQDFDYYHQGIKSVRNGINPYLINTTSTVGPPLVLLYFYPFNFLNQNAARSVTTVINIISGLVMAYILARKFYPKFLMPAFSLTAILFFSAFPTRFSIGMGQPILLLTLLIALLGVQKNTVISGLLLSLLFSLKTFFIFSLVAFWRKPKIIKWFSIFTAITLLTSLTIIKPEWYGHFLSKIAPNLNNAPEATSGLDYYNQSFKSTMFRFGAGGIYNYLFLPIAIILSAIILFTGNFELSIILATILSPISWQHYYVVFFPVFVMLFAVSKKSLKNLLLISIAFLLWWIEFPWMHHASPNLFTALLASHYFISGLVLSFLVVNRK